MSVIKPEDRPGWRPKTGAENTDRAQLAILGSDPYPAVEAPTLDEAVATLDELQTQAIRATANVGWRGHLPVRQGPGHTTAMRLRRAGLPVRKVR